MAHRITVDVGGTFTDVVLADAQGSMAVGKAPTTPDRAFDGVREALEVIAGERATDVGALLADTSVFVYSTTRATNAILERKTARTALVTTEGFPDVLLLREGGKTGPFDLQVPFPEPYVPRRLTYEVAERIGADGEVVVPLDEDAVRAVADRARRAGVEAVAVCLLWSIVNPVHERRVGELLADALPGVPVTLSHELSSVMREYRRASTTAIDASLKPLMTGHLHQFGEDLAAAGFAGELLGATSFGGVMHLDDLAARPVYSAKSGPSLAPVAALRYGVQELGASDVVVCDMGGTSFDVSLIRDGAVTFTRETWLGGQFTGHLLATSSVDVRSVGAGGGSVAWIDPGGLPRVGPESAGAVPGPACYGRGGTRPTVTDAALTLGYLDADGFLGGRMKLDAGAAHDVVAAFGHELELSVEEAAVAIVTIANEHMVAAIAEMTVNEGVDPRESLLLAGGGAAGLTVGQLAAEIGCPRVLVPRLAGALSAVGGQFTDVVAEFSVACPTTTAHFDFDAVNAALADLDAQAAQFAGRLRERGLPDGAVEYGVEARYAYQVWDLELSVPTSRFRGEGDVVALREAFDRLHQRIFAVAEPGQTVELLTWRARLTTGIGSGGPDGGTVPRATEASVPQPEQQRPAYFAGRGWTPTPLYRGDQLPPGSSVEGPAIVSEPTSTLVVHPGTTLTTTPYDNYLLEVDDA